MANPTETRDDHEASPECDFTDGLRGESGNRSPSDVHVVAPDPDVAARFPDAASVREALRAPAAIADRSLGA